MKNYFIIFVRRVRLINNRLINRLRFRHVGKGTWIGTPIRVVNGDRVNIGDNCWILNGIRVEVIKQWNGKEHNAYIEIGNNVSIQQNVHITCAEKITIKDGTCVLANTCITDIKHLFDQVDVDQNTQPIEAREVSIGKNCSIGFGSVILPGVVIGDNVIIGANSVVTKSIPSYSIAVGNPIRIIKKFNFMSGKWEKC